MKPRLAVGLSTCPNDTFAFHGLLTGAVEVPGVELDFSMADVEELNQALARGELDIAKTSFAQALELADEVRVLRVGAALGHGNGPLLLAREQRTELAGARVLGPGARTTAALLYALFHPDGPPPEHVVFSEIMPALEAGTADVGICIHEGRFTYAERGLVALEDLGETWYERTAAPLPLGGIVARRGVPEALVAAFEGALRASIEHAHAHPEEALATMREHAQEHSDEVLRRHVELYVNDETHHLGEAGRAALRALSVEARGARLRPAVARDLEVFTPPRLFHAVIEAEWGATPAETWAPPSLATEGFVHLSLAEQLEGTLAAHFPAEEELLLLELRPERLEAELRFEPSRGGALFPHLYRALRDEDILGWWRLGASPERRLDLAQAAAPGAPPRAPHSAP